MRIFTKGAWDGKAIGVRERCWEEEGKGKEGRAGRAMERGEARWDGDAGKGNGVEWDRS